GRAGVRHETELHGAGIGVGLEEHGVELLHDVGDLRAGREPARDDVDLAPRRPTEHFPLVLGEPAWRVDVRYKAEVEVAAAPPNAVDGFDLDVLEDLGSLLITLPAVGGFDAADD